MANKKMGNRRGSEGGSEGGEEIMGTGGIQTEYTVLYALYLMCFSRASGVAMS